MFLIFLYLVVFSTYNNNIAFSNLNGTLRGKIAIVTGAAQGIGRSIAINFAREGASVVVADINETLGEKVAEEINKMGGASLFVCCDIAQEKDIDKLFENTIKKFGSVDILVNNAAIAIYKRMEDYSPSEWDYILAVNLRSIYLTGRHAIPLMIERGGGVIISMASVHARITSIKNNPYVASKGAVVALTRAMALEGAPYNIRVNCISPGAIATPMLLENWGNVEPAVHPLIPRIPLKRFGKPDEIANIALFLASDASSYITGSEIVVDGGLSIHFD